MCKWCVLGCKVESREEVGKSYTATTQCRLEATAGPSKWIGVWWVWIWAGQGGPAWPEREGQLT